MAALIGLLRGAIGLFTGSSFVGFIVYIFGALVAFLGTMFSMVVLGTTIVLSKFALRLIVAIAFFAFATTKINEVVSTMVTPVLPPVVLDFLCATGIGAGFNMLISAYVIAYSLKLVRRVVIGGD